MVSPNRGKSGLRLAVGVSLVALASGHLALGDRADPETGRELVAKWQGIFGPVDFSTSHGFFEAMRAVGPQPDAVFRDFRDKRLSASIIYLIKYWITAQLNPAYRLDMEAVAPERLQTVLGKRAGYPLMAPYRFAVRAGAAPRYFLGGDKQPGVLAFAWEAGGISFRMMVGGPARLIEITPLGWNPQKGLRADEVSALLLNVLRLKQSTPGKLLTELGLPPVLHIGDRFWMGGERGGIHASSPWYESVGGFVSRTGIVILLNNTTSQPEAAFQDFSSVRPNWLANWIYERDGETLVATGRKDPNLQAQIDKMKIEMAEERERRYYQAFPESAAQLRHMLRNPSPKLRQDVLIALQQKGMPEDYYPVLEEHYITEPSAENRYALAQVILFGPKRLRSIQFLQRTVRSENDPSLRLSLQQMADQLITLLPEQSEIGPHKGPPIKGSDQDK